MKKQFTARSFINVALLLSSLAMLTGCTDWIKNKFGGSSESSTTTSKEVLCSIGDKPCITVESFEDFWNAYLQSNPNAAAIVAFYPNVRYEMFANQLVPLKLAQAWVKAEKKDQEAEYQKRLKNQMELIEGFMALEALKENVLKSIDTSDAALEKFYEENKSKSPIFQQAPFIKNAALVQVETVTFADENQAKSFLEKAKAAGANFAQLVKDAKKELKNLGFINETSKNVDTEIKFRVRGLNAGDFDVVKVGKNFVVIHATNKKDAEYAPYAELKEKPELKEHLKQTLAQIQGQDAFTNKLEELKKTYNVKENKEFFEREKEKQKADMEAKMNQMKEESAKQPEVTAESAQKTA